MDTKVFMICNKENALKIYEVLIKYGWNRF